MIHPGRFTDAHESDIVVFLIGMRINAFHRVGKWLPVAKSMGPMIAELSRDSDSGFLGAEFMRQGLRTIILVQYWRDFDSLETYARAKDREHWPAWTAFNKAVGADGSVGIFHETYAIRRDGFETLYANMPRWGLGKVAGIIPATGSRNEARMRMAAQMRNDS